MTRRISVVVVAVVLNQRCGRGRQTMLLGLMDFAVAVAVLPIMVFKDAAVAAWVVAIGEYRLGRVETAGSVIVDGLARVICRAPQRIGLTERLAGAVLDVTADVAKGTSGIVDDLVGRSNGVSGSKGLPEVLIAIVVAVTLIPAALEAVPVGAVVVLSAIEVVLVMVVIILTMVEGILATVETILTMVETILAMVVIILTMAEAILTLTVTTTTLIMTVTSVAVFMVSMMSMVKS